MIPYKIKIDLEGQRNITSDITLSVGDVNGYGLVLAFYRGGKPFDITGYNLSVYAKPSGSTTPIPDTGTVKDGKGYYVIKSSMYAYAGETQIEIVLSDGASTTVTKVLYFPVRSGFASQGGSIVDEKDYTVLSSLIAKAQDAVAKAEAVVGSAEAAEAAAEAARVNAEVSQQAAETVTENLGKYSIKITEAYVNAADGKLYIKTSDGSQYVAGRVTGDSGVHIGDTAPEDEKVNVWLDTSEGEISDDALVYAEEYTKHRGAGTLDHPDKSVTTKKLADDAVTSEKIAARAVDNAALGLNAVAEINLTSGVRNILAKKVEKETGKGLSQNDFTDADKAKLDAITVVDETALTVDTSKLLLKADPLTLCQTGMTYVDRGETTLLSNVAELHAAHCDMPRGCLLVEYTDTDGKYMVYQRDGKGSVTSFAGTENTTCAYFRSPYMYFAEPTSTTTVTIHRVWSTGSREDNWLTLTLSAEAKGGVRWIFADAAGVWLLYYGTLESDYSTMYIERFDTTGASQWTRAFRGPGKTNYYCTLPYNDTFYDFKYRKAALGADGQLYVAPVLANATMLMPTETYYTAVEHGVYRLNTDGEMTAKYAKRPSTSDIYGYQDIELRGDSMYLFARPGFWRFALNGDDTGTRLWYFNDTTYRLRGLSVDYDNRLHAMLQTSADVQKLVMVRANMDRTCENSSGMGILVNEEIADAHSLARYTKRGLEVFRVPEGTTNLVSRLYVPSGVYEAV